MERAAAAARALLLPHVMTMQGVRAVLFSSVLSTLLAGFGCSPADVRSDIGETDPSNRDIAASPETTAALGVDHWHVNIENGHFGVQGLDEASAPVLDVRFSVAKDAATSSSGAQIRVNLHGQDETMSVIVDRAGQAHVTKNDLRHQQDVERAIEMFQSDAARPRAKAASAAGGQGSLVSSSSLRPLDDTPQLTKPGIDLTCTYKTWDKSAGQLVGGCALFVGSCAGVIVTGEAGLLESGLCAADTVHCIDTATETVPDIAKGDHYECDEQSCPRRVCSTTAPSFYPGTRNPNPNVPQDLCVSNENSRLAQKGDTTTTGDQISEACGCPVQQCKNAVTFIGGPADKHDTDYH